MSSKKFKRAAIYNIDAKFHDNGSLKHGLTSVKRVNMFILNAMIIGFSKSNKKQQSKMAVFINRFRYSI